MVGGIFAGLLAGRGKEDPVFPDLRKQETMVYHKARAGVLRGVLFVRPLNTRQAAQAAIWLGCAHVQCVRFDELAQKGAVCVVDHMSTAFADKLDRTGDL